MNPPEHPRKGRRPSEVAKREKLNLLIKKVREHKKKLDTKSKPN